MSNHFPAWLWLLKESVPIRKEPETLSEFLRPKDVTAIPWDQLSGFVPDFAHMTLAFRGLTGKSAKLIWFGNREKEFEKVKRLLTSSIIVTHFDVSFPVTVLTNASHLYSLGYALGQMIDGKFWLVTCGSKSLTPPQQRYSTIELECLAVHFAVSKWAFNLKGTETFTVATDHRPLEGVFKKDIFEMPYPRLQRIHEKLTKYNMDVKWCQVKAITWLMLFLELHYLLDPTRMMMNLPSTLWRSAWLRWWRKTELRMISEGLDADYFQSCHDVLEDTWSALIHNKWSLYVVSWEWMKRVRLANSSSALDSSFCKELCQY